MHKLLERIRIEVNSNIYVKNPQQTELGKKILKEAIELIDKIGYEEFNFKKLAEKLKTTESSVYRYFENKNRLLLYFVAWYWEMQEYRIVFLTGEAKTAEEKLNVALSVFLYSPKSKTLNTDFDVEKVWRVIASESFKSAITRETNQILKSDMVKLYQRVLQRLAQVIQAINPNYKHSELLAALMLEGITDYRYYNMHWKKTIPAFANDELTLEFFSSFYLNAIKSGYGNSI